MDNKNLVCSKSVVGVVHRILRTVLDGNTAELSLSIVQDDPLNASHFYEMAHTKLPANLTKSVEYV